MLIVYLLEGPPWLGPSGEILDFKGPRLEEIAFPGCFESLRVQTLSLEIVPKLANSNPTKCKLTLLSPS